MFMPIKASGIFYPLISKIKQKNHPLSPLADMKILLNSPVYYDTINSESAQITSAVQPIQPQIDPNITSART
jgi:hypothetical protein